MFDPWTTHTDDPIELSIRLFGRARHDPSNVEDLCSAWVPEKDEELHWRLRMRRRDLIVAGIASILEFLRVAYDQDTGWLAAALRGGVRGVEILGDDDIVTLRRCLVVLEVQNRELRPRADIPLPRDLKPASLEIFLLVATVWSQMQPRVRVGFEADRPPVHLHRDVVELWPSFSDDLDDFITRNRWLDDESEPEFKIHSIAAPLGTAEDDEADFIVHRIAAPPGMTDDEIAYVLSMIERLYDLQNSALAAVAQYEPEDLEFVYHRMLTLWDVQDHALSYAGAVLLMCWAAQMFSDARDDADENIPEVDMDNFADTEHDRIFRLSFYVHECRDMEEVLTSHARFRTVVSVIERLVAAYRRDLRERELRMRAVAMSQHGRLGAGSGLRALDDEMLRQITEHMRLGES